MRSISAYARELLFRPLRRRCGGTRRNPEAKALVRELSAIGNNLNQIARHLNTTGDLRDWGELREAMTMHKEAISRVSPCDRAAPPDDEQRYPGDAAAMIPRMKVGKGVTGAVRYVLGEGRDPKTGELKPSPANGNTRVDWMSGTGFGFEIETEADADLARRVMEFDALNQSSRTRLCEQDCVHLSLAWARGETPSRKEMEDAAHEALEALGMGNAKALFVAHNDEDYAHVHIVASKINPDTGRAYDLAKSWRTLSTWAEGYEREHGGIQLKGREDANELRAAIAARDPAAVLEAMTRQRATFTGKEFERALQKEIYCSAEPRPTSGAASSWRGRSLPTRFWITPTRFTWPRNTAGRPCATRPAPSSRPNCMCCARPTA